MTKLIQQLNFSSSISKYDVDVAGLEPFSLNLKKKFRWVFLDYLSILRGVRAFYLCMFLC